MRQRAQCPKLIARMKGSWSDPFHEQIGRGGGEKSIGFQGLCGFSLHGVYRPESVVLPCVGELPRLFAHPPAFGLVTISRGISYEAFLVPRLLCRRHERFCSALLTRPLLPWPSRYCHRHNAPLARRYIMFGSAFL